MVEEGSKNLLFVNKKKQKNLDLLGVVGGWVAKRLTSACWKSGRDRANGTRQSTKSFLLLFFKKEVLAC
jgi:hypothetical protein